MSAPVAVWIRLAADELADSFLKVKLNDPMLVIFKIRPVATPPKPVML